MRGALDAGDPATLEFVLDEDELDDEAPITARIRLKGSGRRISFKFSNGTVDENFRLDNMSVSFRVSDERQLSV